MPSSIPEHVLELLRPLHEANSSFSISHDRISSSTSSQEYLYKTAPVDNSTQLVGEVESLRCINEASAEAAPKLIGSGRDEQGREWMLSEWHQLSSIPSSEQGRLAEFLAKMHLAPPPSSWSNSYGFSVPTCCGVTVQDNTKEEDWATFWGERRIGDMARRIGDDEISKLSDELNRRVIPHLLGKLDIKPSILHGDLWSGNARFSKDRNAPITFDPSSYFGHSEADLGVTRMFGGFSPAFYERYHEIVPKASPVEEYDQRMDLYELYHHLNHTLMFGGGYRSGASRLMKGLLSWADEKGI